MKSSINRYIVKRKYGDKMLSLINRFHYRGDISMTKDSDKIVYTVSSDREEDFYDILPSYGLDRTDISDRLKNAYLFIKKCIQSDSRSKLNNSIADFNLIFDDIMCIISNIDNADKLLIIDNLCVYIGIQNRVYRLDHTHVSRYCPQFDMFKGFIGDNLEINYLNKIHLKWLNNSMKGDLFVSDKIDTFSMTSYKFSKILYE